MNQRYAAPNFNPLIAHQVAILASLDYRRRRTYIVRKIEGDSPRRFLYKFRPLNAADSVSVDRLRAIVVRSELWLNSIADFSDPSTLPLE